MSEASDELAGRIDRLIGDRPGVTRKRMFGGICFMLSGNMVCGATKPGTLLLRTGPERYREALTRPGAGPMLMGEREMSGFIEVTDDIEDDDNLADWIAFALDFVGTLPPKDAANAAAGRPPAKPKTARKAR